MAIRVQKVFRGFGAFTRFNAVRILQKWVRKRFSHFRAVEYGRQLRARIRLEQAEDQQRNEEAAQRAMARLWRKHRQARSLFLQTKLRGYLGRVRAKRLKQQLEENERERLALEKIFVDGKREDVLEKAKAFVLTKEGKALLAAEQQKQHALRTDHLKWISTLDPDQQLRERCLLEFDMFDLDGSGAIDLMELTFLLRELAVVVVDPSQRTREHKAARKRMSKEERKADDTREEEEAVQKILERVDTDGSGEIEFDEFLVWKADPATDDFREFKELTRKTMFSSRRGFARGVAVSIKAFSKWRRKRSKQAEKKKRDRKGITAERLAKCSVIRDMMAAAVPKLRREFRITYPPPFECQTCLRTFTTVYHLERHVARRCKGEDPSTAMIPEPIRLVNVKSARSRYAALYQDSVHDEPEPEVTPGVPPPTSTAKDIPTTTAVDGGTDRVATTIETPESTAVTTTTASVSTRGRSNWSLAEELRECKALEEKAAQAAVKLFTKPLSAWGKVLLEREARKQKEARVRMLKSFKQQAKAERREFKEREKKAKALAKKRKLKRRRTAKDARAGTVDRKRKRYLASIAFKRFDLDSSCSLDHDEFVIMMRDIGLGHLSEEAIQEILSAIDTDHSGSIGMEEFILWYTGAEIVGVTASQKMAMGMSRMRAKLGNAFRDVSGATDRSLARHALVLKERKEARKRARDAYRGRCPPLHSCIHCRRPFMSFQTYEAHLQERKRVGFCKDDTIAISEDERAVNAFLNETQSAFGPIGGGIQDSQPIGAGIQDSQPIGESNQNNKDSGAIEGARGAGSLGESKQKSDDNEPIGADIQPHQPIGESKQNQEDSDVTEGAHESASMQQSNHNNDDTRATESAHPTEPMGVEITDTNPITKDPKDSYSSSTAPPPTRVFRSSSIKRVQVAPAPEDVDGTDKGN